MRDLEKPRWDSARIGKPSAFTAAVSDDEMATTARVRDQVLAEASAIADSTSRGLMTKDQRFVESARSREQRHRANLDLFLSLPETDEQQIFAHREGLAVALYQQGKFDEALTVIREPDNAKALEHFPDLRARIVAYRNAVGREDTEDCRCEPIRKTIVIAANKAVEIEERPRVDVEPILSPKHGEVIRIWQCSICGFVNAHNRIPEDQVQISERRSQIEAGQIEKITAEMSDSRLLAAN